MTTLIRNIFQLVHIEESAKLKYCGSEMNNLKTIENSFLLIENGLIHSYGFENEESISSIRREHSGLEEIDADKGCVFPSWCDSHTHLVYAGSREKEFTDRINGRSYEEIASRGGGILNSANRLRSASAEELFESASERIHEIISLGTGAVEIKSGYGLTLESELKMLRVISQLKSKFPLTIKSTFLGAHAVPTEYKNNKERYISLLISEMLPAIAAENLADYCDIFCEKNYFTKEDALRIFEAANKYNIIPKVHAEQLSHSGGIEAGVESNAISVDHLEYANDNDIQLLKKSETMPVLLPGAQFFLGLQNPPARKMIEEGLPVAISSDFNPGSCPSGNMNQMVSFACINYELTPSESIIAAINNSAYAMGISKTHGSICKGKKANIFITRPIPSYEYLPYYFGNSVIRKVLIDGEVF